MAETKKYIVAPGFSFVGNKRTYKEGDEIDASAFKNEKRFQSFISGDKPKIILAPPKEATNKKDEDEDVSGVDVSGVNVDRPALEKLFIDGGIFDKEKLSKIPDDKLLKLAVKKGLIKK